NQRRLSQAFCQRFLRDGAAYSAISILERVNTLKIKMRDGSSRQRSKRLLALFSCLVEPLEKATHFQSHPRRWRGFKMYTRRIDSSGDDLHWFRSGSEPSNILQIAPAGNNHFVPSKQHFFRQRFRERTVQINHHT